MITPDNRLFCRLDGLSVSAREQQRKVVMKELGLLNSESIPVFEEATQTAAHFLEAPICLLGLVDQDRQWFKSAVGLSRLGLMNELATSRQCLRSESFCAHVVDSRQILAISDTAAHPAFASSLLAHQYGVRAYLGVPLFTANGSCVGTLAVMDLKPRQFSDKDIEFLVLTARWSMSEFERQAMSPAAPTPAIAPPASADSFAIANQLNVELLSQLTQELRTPLTSVMGMASVLTREIYGPLTSKQKEYLGIIHHSGQYLLSLVNEILELSSLKHTTQQLNLTSVDIEMLCQQAINTLEQAAQRREQQIRLSVEPGRRIWLMDKDKVRQLLYHLVFSIIQVSTAGSIVRLHVSQRDSNLTIAVWVSHPWLGEGLLQPDLYFQPPLVAATVNSSSMLDGSHHSFEADSSAGYPLRLSPEVSPEGPEILGQPAAERLPRSDESSALKNLGLLLSQQLAEMHGGRITMQGTAESGYRYLISLPQTSPFEERL